MREQISRCCSFVCVTQTLTMTSRGSWPSWCPSSCPPSGWWRKRSAAAKSPAGTYWSTSRFCSVICQFTTRSSNTTVSSVASLHCTVGCFIWMKWLVFIINIITLHPCRPTSRSTKVRSCLTQSLCCRWATVGPPGPARTATGLRSFPVLPGSDFALLSLFLSISSCLSRPQQKPTTSLLWQEPKTCTARTWRW